MAQMADSELCDTDGYSKGENMSVIPGRSARVKRGQKLVKLRYHEADRGTSKEPVERRTRSESRYGDQILPIEREDDPGLGRRFES
jgi:hypothetical protein